MRGVLLLGGLAGLYPFHCPHFPAPSVARAPSGDCSPERLCVSFRVGSGGLSGGVAGHPRASATALSTSWVTSASATPGGPPTVKAPLRSLSCWHIHVTEDTWLIHCSTPCFLFALCHKYCPRISSYLDFTVCTHCAGLYGNQFYAVVYGDQFYAVDTPGWMAGWASLTHARLVLLLPQRRCWHADYSVQCKICQMPCFWHCGQNALLIVGRAALKPFH